MVAGRSESRQTAQEEKESRAIVVKIARERDSPGGLSVVTTSIVQSILEAPMPLLSSSTSRAFVEAVKLPEAPARVRGTEVTDTPPIDLKETDAQSLVVGSSLIVAAEKVPVETLEDLINCTLFAQLAATAAVGTAQKISDWYDAYFRTLTAIGWAQSDTQFEEYEFKSKN